MNYFYIILLLILNSFITNLFILFILFRFKKVIIEIIEKVSRETKFNLNILSKIAEKLKGGKNE